MARLLSLQYPAQGFARGIHQAFSRLPEVAVVLCIGLLCHCQMPCMIPYERGPCVVQEKHDRSTV